MPTTLILTVLLVLAALAFGAGYARIRALTVSRTERPHSRPSYHGAYLAIVTVLPAILATIAWSAAEMPVIRMITAQSLPASVDQLAKPQRQLLTGQIDKIADTISLLSAEDRQIIEKSRLGFATMADAQAVLLKYGTVLGSAPEAYVITGAYDQAVNLAWSRLLSTGLAALMAAAGFFWGYRRIAPKLHARNTVESVMKGGLIVGSSVAILTTLGIVLSVLFETLHFFHSVPPAEFFFGTVWDPRFSAADAGAGGTEGQFGLLPLLWGTLFISFVALSVAVPIGLFAAIYMAEYASDRFRGIAKPALEILAGIPTIVYGFFALVTFGPLMRDLGASVGLDIAASSVLTAGIVMGVMIIPFVSSLSDDIITAVPQSLRDGSFGLGATRSETIKLVVLPAALPGIVGAVLLAASRAIGETMIVVLAAGIAANLTLNPFEPVTTMTVKIVSQLTGDLEFDSPQTLVAFALGMTLFVITLALNVYALYIVRKYREQYE